MGLYRDEVVVLRLHPYRDRDRIVHTLARERGRLGLLARGARSPRGPLAARLQLGNRLEVTYHRGPHASLGTLREAALLEDHQRLQGDLDAFAALEVMLEAAGHLAHEDAPEPELFEALVAGLAALERGEGRRAVVPFLLAALAAAGLWGGGDRCERCGRPWAGEVRELTAEGHALWCGGCAGGRGRPLAPGLLLALAALAAGRRVALTEAQERRALRLLAGRIASHAHRPLRSLPFLESLG